MGDKGKRWAALTVIAVLLAAVLCAFWATGNHLPRKDADGFYILPEAVFHYNIFSRTAIIDAWPDSSNFVEELSPEEIAALVPDGRFPCTGTAEWDITGKLRSVSIQVEINGDTVKVLYSLTGVYHEDPRKTITQCNGVRFAVVEDVTEERYPELRATGDLGTQAVTVSMWCTDERLEQERQNFETVVRWMSICKGKQPDFSRVDYSRIPEYINRDISEAEAYGDETFGHMLPDELPEGFEPTYFFRFKNYRFDSLYGKWEKGSSHVGIRVERCTAEDEASVIRSEDAVAAAKELYDPIFELEDLTAAVIEARKGRVASNADTHLWVKCGEYLVSVASDGISAEELYEILQRFQK